MTNKRTSSVVQGLAALGAIITVVVGLPILLALVGQVPDLTTWSVQGLMDVLTSPDNGTVALIVLTLGAWTVWAIFTLVIVVEVIAHLRRRPSLRLPGLRWAQGLAAGLVSTVVVGLSSGTAALAATAPPVPVEAPAYVQPSTTDIPHASTPAPAEEPQATRTYTVRDGDTYWSIAAAHLGAGERYTEIVDLNLGRTMADGVVFTGDEYPHPGWELRLPEDADTSTAPEEPAEHVHTVSTGDTLSGIAEEHLGAPEAYPELFDANAGKPQPHSGVLTDPDLIHPGWKITIPADAAPEAEDAPAEQVTSEEADEQPDPPSETDASPAPEADSPAPDETTSSPSPSAQPSDHPQAVDETPAPTPQAEAQAGAHADDDVTLDATLTADETDDADDAALLSRVVGFSALGATGLALLLVARRHVQMLRRRPGQRIAQPTQPDIVQAEEDLHASADPVSAELLDRALRSLSAKCASTRSPLPHVVGVRLTGQDCELIVDQDQGIPVTPFRPVDDTTWRLNPSSSALLPIDRAMTVPAPYPALATIGQDDNGTQIFLNLTQVGAVGLRGDPAAAEEVLTAVAVELSTSPAADHVNVNCVGGIAPGLDRLVKTQRVRAFDRVEDCLRELELQTLEYASNGPSEDTAPEVVLSAAPLSQDNLARLGRILGSQAAPPIALVSLETDHNPLPGGWHLDADNPGPQPLPWPLDSDVTVHRLNHTEYSGLAALLTTAEVAVSVPAPGWENVPQEVGTDSASTLSPPPPAPTKTAPPAASGVLLPPSLTDYEVRIRVLGPVAIEGVDTDVLEKGRRRTLTELACYLALRPGRTGEQIARALGGPRGPWSKSSLNTHLSKLRAWLGRDSTGAPRFPTMQNGTYSLASTVGCDWAVFQEMARFGLEEDTQRATAQLEQALKLVTDTPFSKVGLDRYGWAEPLKPEINAAIVDVAHTIATRHLRDGFLEAARTALLQVLELDPTCELLYRDLLRIEHKAGNQQAIDRAIQRLHIALDRIDTEMSEETEKLISQLK